MPKVKTNMSNNSSKKMRPALSPEARENQLISLAVDLVEQRLIDGTASSQETTHFLKLATAKTRYEKQLMEKQIELMTAKTEQIRSEQHKEELYEEVINALRKYNGQDDSDEEY